MTDMTNVKTLGTEVTTAGTRYSLHVNRVALVAMDCLAFFCAWFLYGINEESKIAWVLDHQFSIQTLIHFLWYLYLRRKDIYLDFFTITN